MDKEARAIFAELMSRHPHNSPWLNFSADESCKHKKAARDFINSINLRLSARPELLTCIIETDKAYEFSVDLKRVPLFIVLQMWIYKNYAYMDKFHARQLWTWLQGSTKLIPDDESEHSYVQRRYAELMEIVFDTYDFISLDFVDIDEFVRAVERHVPASKVLFAKYSERIIEQHFEDVFGSRYNREKPKLTLQQRQRMAYFLNKMRIASIVDGNTVATFTVYADHSYQKNDEYRENAIAYFSSQQIVTGYEELKIPTASLLLTSFKQALSKEFDLVSLSKIESYIELHNSRNPEAAVELSKQLVICIDPHLNQNLCADAELYNLRMFAMRQAITSKDQNLLLLAINGLSEIIAKQTSSDNWFDLFAAALEALKVPGISKEVIADELVKILEEACKLDTEQKSSLREEMISGTANAGKILFSILFNKMNPQHHESSTNNVKKPKLML